MNIRDYKTVLERRKAVEKQQNVDLKHIGAFTLDEGIAGTRNCENMIGAAQIPMGVAGPLRIAKKEYYVPLATTEGALVASVNRGCKAITASGGAMVDSYRVGATRGPVFKVHSWSENVKLYDFVMGNKEKFNQLARTTSGHIELIDVDARCIGHHQFVRFAYNTQDAMGLNMVTIATQKIVDFIEKQTDTQCISLAGNFDVDKKPAWSNFIRGRGFEVWAEVVIPEKVLREVLKTSAQKVYDVWLAKCMIGSAISGSMGFNAHYANIVAAIFLATGQDPAHVVEGSLGITTAEVVDRKNLYMSVYLPDVMVGTVGGGTGLATQREALAILGVAKSEKLAEIIGAAALAGEVSLLSSLEEGSLTRAHQKLGRGGK